ncbi:MAG: FAD-dependent oxidoreductase [Planctomycetota bacterium]
MADLDWDILIVGAGMAGASTAYHLARTTDLRILIVERETTPGVHSSGRNASYIRERMEDPAIQPLATQGAEFLREGTLAEYTRCGALLLGLGDEDVAKHVPVARGKGLWCPKDGVIDVAALLQSYLSGRKILFDTEVRSFSRKNDAIEVTTNRGVITCGLLVNAAGPWAGQLGGLPLTPLQRHIFVTPPMDWVDPNWPFVWDTFGGLYFRPESGGLLLSACDETAAPPGDYSEDPAVLEDLAEKLASRQPRLSDIAIRHSWVGQRTFAADRRFVIGFDPRNDRLFHVAGLGGHGVTTSYTVGKMAAEMILNKTGDLQGLFSPTRLL